jgi:hypothetical protein
LKRNWTIPGIRQGEKLTKAAEREENSLFFHFLRDIFGCPVYNGI